MSDSLIGGRYERLERIGHGGMAAVYRCRDRRLLREVAVKVILTSGSDGEQVFYFHREARAIASLQHPNIVQIFDYSGPDEEPAYIVMQLVQGGDLARVIRELRPPPEAVLLSVARTIAGALEHAHERGVIHRDLKPGNILLDLTGNLLLTDFGLAKGYRDPAILGKTAVGRHTVLFGTPNYMSPEQLLAQELGPPADVFALGVLLYELAAGERPFDDVAPTAVWQRILDGAYDPLPSHGRGDLSSGFADLVHLCLCVAPADRPSLADLRATCDAMLRSLRVPPPADVIRAFVASPDALASEATALHRPVVPAAPAVSGARPMEGDATTLDRPVRSPTAPQSGAKAPRAGVARATPDAQPVDAAPPAVRRPIGNDDTTVPVRREARSPVAQEPPAEVPHNARVAALALEGEPTILTPVAPLRRGRRGAESAESWPRRRSSLRLSSLRELVPGIVAAVVVVAAVAGALALRACG